MPISQVSGQTAQGSGAGGSASSTLTNNPRVGNLVVVYTWVLGSGVTPTITDSNSNTYTLTSASPFFGTGGGGGSTVTMAIGYLPNAPTNATKTITAAWSGGTTTEMWVAEFSNVASTKPIEVNAGEDVSTPNSAPADSPSLTYTNFGDLWFGGIAISGASISSCPIPFTQVGTTGASGAASEYAIDAAGRTLRGDYFFSGGGNATWTGLAAAFLQAPLDWFQTFREPEVLFTPRPRPLVSNINFQFAPVPYAQFRETERPTPPKPGLQAASQQFYTGSLRPLVTPTPIGQAPTQPPPKAGLLTAQQQFYTGSLRPLVTPTPIGLPPTQPPPKPSLLTAAQQFWSGFLTPIVTPTPIGQAPVAPPARFLPIPDHQAVAWTPFQVITPTPNQFIPDPIRTIFRPSQLQFWAGTIAPIVTPTPNQQIPDPVRTIFRPGQLQFWAGLISPIVTPTPNIQTPDPIWRRLFIAGEASALVPFTQTTPTPQQQFPDPIRLYSRAHLGPEPYQNIFPLPSVTTPTVYAFFADTAPAARRPIAAYNVDFIVAPQTAAPSFGWYQDLVIPNKLTKPALLTGQNQDFAYNPFPQVFTGAVALSAATQFLRNAGASNLVTNVFFNLPFVPPPPTGNFVATVYSEAISQRSQQTPAFMWDFFWNPNTPPPAVVLTVYDQIPEPIRTKPGLITAAQQFIAYDPFPFTFTSMAFFEPLSEPVRTKPGLGAWLQEAYPAFWPFPLPNAVAWGWYTELSIPVRTKPGLLTGQNQDLAFDTFPFPPWGWYIDLSIPVRTKPGLLAGQNQDLGYDPFPFAFTNFAFYQALSEPVRIKPGLLAGQHQDLAWVFPQFTTFWFNWLSEPVRTKPGLPAALNQDLWYNPFPFAFTSMAFFEALSEPVRQKPGLGAWLQQFYPAFWPFPLPNFSFSWYANLSEPVRLKPGLLAGQNQDLAFHPFPFPNFSFAWYAALSEPVRTKPGLLAALQMAYPALDPFPFTFTNTAFFMALSEPVRLKPGLGAWLQPFYPAFDPFPFTFTSMAFFQAFSEPVRFKPGLHPSLIQYLIYTSTPVIQVTYTIRMAATERKDIFRGALRSYRPPVFAYVSIHEDAGKKGYVGIAPPRRP